MITPIIEMDLSEFALIMLGVQLILLAVQIATQMIGLNKLKEYLASGEGDCQKILMEMNDEEVKTNYNLWSFFNDKLFPKMLSLSLLFCTLLDFG